MTEAASTPNVDEQDLAYFKDRCREAEYFCSRFPGGIPFEGLRVLDFGSGHGATTLLAAQRGAVDVLGVDVGERQVSVAHRICSTLYTELAGKVSFEVRDILVERLPAQRFDIIISEATFEHVTGLPDYLDALREALRPGGRLYTGFSPLYNAPRGDHDRLKAPLRKVFPWAHLCWPRRWLLRRVGADSLADIGLSGLALRDYLEMFEKSGMTLKHLEINNQRSPVARLIEPLRAHTPLRELLSYSVYAVLERPRS